MSNDIFDTFFTFDSEEAIELPKVEREEPAPIILRDNQLEPVKKGVEFFQSKNPQPSIIIAPTAFGKSIVIAQIAHQLGEKIVVIQPSKELLEQNYNKFISLGGQASIYSASMGVKEIGEVTYATIGSIVEIPHKFRELGISKVIIDECDRFPREGDGMLRKFLGYAKITHILGLTATPLKLQTNMGADGVPFSKLVMLTSRSKKGNFFKEIIHVAQIKEMVDLKFWSPLVYESYDFRSGDLVYNSTKADFTEASISKSYKNQNIGQKIIKKCEELIDRKSILVAVPSVDDAKELVRHIPKSAALYSGMPNKERKKIVSDFKSGKLRVVLQVNILAVGFDHPELDCIITGRPTASLSWWYQFVGRVTRIHPKKANGLVIDFVGSVPRFGKVEDFYFKKEGQLWKLFGEGGKLLTGIPMHEIGNIFEGDPEPAPQPKVPLEQIKPMFMPFGKYKGTLVTRLPGWYRDWLLKEFKWTPQYEDLRGHLLKIKN
jgi:DNA repair protein RadD